MTPVTGKTKRLWGYLKPYWRLQLLTFLVMVAIAALTLALPLALQYLIDNLIPRLIASAGGANNWQPMVLFGLVLVGIYLLFVLFSWMRDYLAGIIASKIMRDVRSQLFGHLERLSLTFFQSHQVGEMMSRLLSDVARMQDLLSSTLLATLTNVLLLIAILGYLLTVNAILTLVALAPVPITIILTHRYGKKIHVIAKTLQEQIAKFSARIQESLLGVKTVKAFGREEREQQRVDNVLGEMTQSYIRMSVTRSLSINLVNFFGMIGPIIVLTGGAYLVIGGTMKLGALVAFFFLLSYLYSPIQTLASINVEVQGAMASVNRIFEYLDIAPEIQEDPHPVTLKRARGDVIFDNVTFSYGAEGFRLADFKLVIPPLQKIAVVGPSGAGKTTIINLLMRLYDPESGTITLDGIDLKKLSIRSLRDNFALVDQDPFLFNMTIEENIAYSNLEATHQDVIEAAKIANIHEFIISQKSGYETIIGERGVTLSGGEKQRICLARAILRKPSVLILDEATSALDSISERLIQDALDKILADMTAIVIAHRLSTVQKADRIITLENGRITDEGTHAELMGKSALYRELAQKQFQS